MDVRGVVALVGGIVAGIVTIFYLDANLPPVSPTAAQEAASREMAAYVERHRRIVARYCESYAEWKRHRNYTGPDLTRGLCDTLQPRPASPAEEEA